MLRILKLTTLLVVATGALLCLQEVREVVLPPVANWLDLDGHPECAPYAVVLPGDEVRRALTAAGLVRIGMAQYVLIPQNPESADVRDGITLPTAQISRKILLHRGIPADRIVLLPSESRTTFDDARAVAEFLRGTDAHVTVVTNAFHTRRAEFVFRKVLGSDAERLGVVSAPNPGFDSTNWWLDEEGLRLILTEYLKLAFYYVRYCDPLVAVVCGVLILAIGWWRMTAMKKKRLHVATHNGN